MYPCKQGTAEINHVNWELEGKNVRASRKYIIRMFSTLRESGDQSFGEEPASRHVNPEVRAGGSVAENRLCIKPPVKAARLKICLNGVNHRLLSHTTFDFRSKKGRKTLILKTSVRIFSFWLYNSCASKDPADRRKTDLTEVHSLVS